MESGLLYVVKAVKKVLEENLLRATLLSVALWINMVSSFTMLNSFSAAEPGK